MAIFGKRKDTLDEPTRPQNFSAPVDEFGPPSDLPDVEEASDFGVEMVAPPTPREKAEESAENLAPVFVKVSKYKDILNTVNYLKMGFSVMKNQISILSKLMRIEKDNMDLLYQALEKVSGQLAKLDSDFTKPVDFMSEVANMKAQDVSGLERTMDDLKAQIEKLKGEVETLA